jgi:hypothetical protein
MSCSFRRILRLSSIRATSPVNVAMSVPNPYSTAPSPMTMASIPQARSRALSTVRLPAVDKRLSVFHTA